MFDKRYVTFYYFAQFLSFTKTAEALFLTQPAVSQQMKALEEELQLTLIQKEKGQMQLTATGEKLYAYLQANFSQSADFFRQLQAKESKTILRFGATLSVSQTILPDFLKSLTSDYDEIKVKIANTKENLEAIRKGEIVFSLVEGNFDKKEFSALTLKDSPFVAVTGKEELAKNTTSQSIQRLFHETLLLREKGSGSRSILEHWLGMQNFQLTDFPKRILIPDPTTIVSLLEKKVGVAFLYRSLVEEALKEKRLYEIPLGEFEILHPINFVYLKNSFFASRYHQMVENYQKERREMTP